MLRGEPEEEEPGRGDAEDDGAQDLDDRPVERLPDADEERADEDQKDAARIGGDEHDIDVLSQTFCGKSRPIHFRGVCTVITKLLNIVGPNKIFFGQKDAQQLAIVRRMVRDLNFDVEVVGCPIVRESDSLDRKSVV